MKRKLSPIKTPKKAQKASLKRQATTNQKANKKAIARRLAKVEAKTPEEAPVQVTRQELQRRRKEKEELLQKLRQEMRQANAKEVINGQEVDYLNEFGSDGRSWRTYGVGPTFKTGRLTRHENGTWSIHYNYTEVVSNVVQSRRKKSKIRYSLGGLIIESSEVPFLDAMDVLHHASNPGIKSVTRSAIAPARREISLSVAKAIKALNGETLRKMAGALDALMAIENRQLTGERVVQIILSEAIKQNRIPCMGEVQTSYEIAFPQETGEVFSKSRWSQIFKEIGFCWLPKVKSGPTPKKAGRKIRWS